MKLKTPIPAPWTAFTTADNLSWSFARVTSGALIGACIFWVTFIVVQTKKIPDNLDKLAYLVLSIYGINRGAEAYVDAKQPQPPDKTES